MIRQPNLLFEIDKAWRLLTGPLRALPSIVIPGAPKCGTSTLYDYLAAHPDVRRGARKEPTNFVHFPGSRLRAAMNYPLRLPGASFHVCDGSVEYFTHPDAPANVRAILPDARLIFLFRDPVKRAWSDYQMFYKFGSDRSDFGASVRAAMKWLGDPSLSPLVDAAARQAWHPARYVLAGWYARAVERWLDIFPREQCQFLISEEFYANPAGMMAGVFRHAGLREVPVQPLPTARDGGYSEKMPADVESELREFFTPRNARLAEILGRELPWK